MIANPEIKHLPSMLGKRMQLGIVVSDMDATLKYWTEVMGVGPFVAFDTSVGDRLFYHRGKRSAVEFRIAFAYLGDIQVEVIQPITTAPSIYNEFLDSGRQGLQHIAFWPEDFEKACKDLERSGFKEVSSMSLKDGTKNVAYFDTPSPVGIMVEIVPWTADRAKYFGGIKALSDNWDGSRPIRRYPTRAEFLASDDCKA